MLSQIYKYCMNDEILCNLCLYNLSHVNHGGNY